METNDREKVTATERGSEGLTLIELLVAMAVFAIIITGILFYVLRTAQFTGRHVDTAVNIQQTARTAIEQLSRELRMAGYHRKSDLAVGPTATAAEIEFEAQVKAEALNDLPQRIGYKYENNKLYRRASEAIAEASTAHSNPDCGGIRAVTDWGTADEGLTSGWRLIADNIKTFSLTYFSTEGSITTPLTAPTCAQLNKLQRVQVDMELEVSSPYPGTTTPITVKLRTDVQTRNSGIFGGCDSTAPDMPGGMGVTDTCLCTRLEVVWGTVTAPDLAGYTVFVGRNPGAWDTMIDVGQVNSLRLDQSNANLQRHVTYYVAVAARDNCRNLSPLAIMRVASDPGCGSGDTTPSPTVPETVDISTVETIPGVGSITLRWSPILHNGVVRDDLIGYRVYRRVYNANPPGAFACISCGGMTSVSVDYIPGKGVNDKYQFIDTDPNLVGCQVYEYYIVGLNCEGESLPTASIFGDGAGPQPDSPGGANTMPRDITPPGDPVPLVVGAGSNEVLLTFTTPNNVDFTGVLILRSQGTAPPEAVNGQPPACPTCVQVYQQAGLAPNNTIPQPVRDTNGVVNGQTYFYRAYAYDLCGNYSPGTNATGQAKPCDDAPPPTPPQWYTGPPPAPTLLSLVYCRTSVTLTWQAPTQLNTVNGQMEIPPDLQLYRIFRDNVMIKEVAASLSATDSDFDPDSYAGKAVTYQVTAVDCATPANESAKSNTLTAYPGAVIVDETNREKFVTRGNDHNEYFFLIRNTSAAIATVNSMSAEYSQPSARIQRVDFFTVQSTNPLNFTFEKTAFVDNAAPIDLKSTDEVLFTDKPQLAGQGPLTSYRVVRLVFTDENGDTAAADMRGETITLTLRFFLAGSAMGSSCTQTASQLTIPNGPRFSNTKQLPPSLITFLPSTILVGSYVVPGGQETNVQTTIVTDDGSAPISARLFWTTTSKSALLPPARPFTNQINMLSLAGNLFTIFDDGSSSGTKIPVQDGKRVWYYIEATDNRNNINIDPSATKAYTYDQSVIDPCINTPRTPTGLSASTCATVRLSWSPVTQNTDGTPITDLLGYKITRFTDSTFTTIASGYPVTVAADTVSYNDTVANPAVQNFYRVVAFDKCLPTSKESGFASVTAPAFAGASGTPTITPSVSSVHPFIYPPNGSAGDAGVFNITISDPFFACDLTSNQVAFVHFCAASGQDDDWFQVIEDGDSGVFRIDSSVYSGRNFLQAIFNNLAGPSNPQANLDLRVLKTDTINLCWHRELVRGAEGTSCSPCDAVSQVAVTPDPCLDTPGVPNLTAASKGTGNSRMNLTWTAPATNTDGSAIVDLGGFTIWRRLGTTGTPEQIGQFSAATLTVDNFDIGVNLNSGDFYFAVKAIDTCSPLPNSSDFSNFRGPF